MNFRSSLWLGALAWATASCSLDMSRYPTSQDQDAAVIKQQPPPDGIARLSIDAAHKYQTLEGFGAAVAWYAETFAYFAGDAQIYDDAFKELGLDILRFRDHYGRQDQNSSSDISAEAAILSHATQSLGRAPKILLSSWSPPANLKVSGLENCSNNDPDNKTNCTLARDSNGFVYDAFADYFVNSLDYYAASGIVPDYLSIQNEPNFAPNGWEGCHFEPSETSDLPGYDQALSAVQTALSSVTDAPKLLGPEPISLGSGILDAYVTDVTREKYDVLAHHLYSSGYWKTPDSYLTQMANANATAGGLPLFQTEFDTQGDGGSSGGFETAWVMHNSLAVEGVSGFLYWGLIWPGSSGSLISVNKQSYTLRGQYYAMRHYARYTDPGYARVDVASSLSSVRASAYLAPDSSQLTLVMLNVGDDDAHVSTASIAGFSATRTEAYQSTFKSGDAGASEYWTLLEDFDITHQFTMPSHSVLTVVLNSGESDAGRDSGT